MTLNQTLETERLVLRSLSIDDTPFIHRLISDPSVRQFLGGPVPVKRRNAAISNYFAPDKGEAVWLVETNDIQRAIGLISITNHKDGKETELSYQFKREAWGMGYAAEATLRVLLHAVNGCGLSNVIAETQTANKASCRLLKRLGMTERDRVQRFGAEQIIYSSGKDHHQVLKTNTSPAQAKPKNQTPQP